MARLGRLGTASATPRSRRCRALLRKTLPSAAALILAALPTMAGAEPRSGSCLSRPWVAFAIPAAGTPGEPGARRVPGAPLRGVQETASWRDFELETDARLAVSTAVPDPDPPEERFRGVRFAGFGLDQEGETWAVLGQVNAPAVEPPRRLTGPDGHVGFLVLYARTDGGGATRIGAVLFAQGAGAPTGAHGRPFVANELLRAALACGPDLPR